MPEKHALSVTSPAGDTRSSLTPIADKPPGVCREKLGDQSLPHKGLCCSIVSSRIPMKPLLFALCTAFGFCSLSIQEPVWQPSPGHTQIPIWPGAAPDPQPVRGPENMETAGKIRRLDTYPQGSPQCGHGATKGTLNARFSESLYGPLECSIQ